jgi:hypothetical protein
MEKGLPCFTLSGIVSLVEVHKADVKWSSPHQMLIYDSTQYEDSVKNSPYDYGTILDFD